MEEENHLAEEYVQEFVLDHLDIVKREGVCRERASSDANNNNNNNEENFIPQPQHRLPSIHNNTILMPPHASPGAHHQILTPPRHNGEENIFGQDGINPMHHHHAAMRLYQTTSPGSRHEMMHYPDTPGTPPATPPVSNSPDSPLPHYIDSHHPQHPNLHCLTKPEIMDGHWRGQVRTFLKKSHTL